jgi:hypothetical protein
MRRRRKTNSRSVCDSTVGWEGQAIVNRQLTTARLDGDGSKTAKGIQKKSNDKKEHNSAADARAFCRCLVVDAD